MAQEDTEKWCRNLTEEELHARPYNLPSVAFQLRHIARSLDRFCTYAESRQLTPTQFEALAAEMDPTGTPNSIFQELQTSLAQTKLRLTQITQNPPETPIKIGRQHLPTTLAGLLVHAAEHTQRHVGQAITTAKLLLAQRD